MSEFCCGATSVSPNSETSEDEEGEAESEERRRKLVDEEDDMIEKAIAEADNADERVMRQLMMGWFVDPVRGTKHKGHSLSKHLLYQALML